MPDLPRAAFLLRGLEFVAPPPPPPFNCAAVPLLSEGGAESQALGAAARAVGSCYFFGASLLFLALFCQAKCLDSFSLRRARHRHHCWWPCFELPIICGRSRELFGLLYVDVNDTNDIDKALWRADE